MQDKGFPIYDAGYADYEYSADIEFMHRQGGGGNVFRPLERFPGMATSTAWGMLVPRLHPPIAKLCCT